MCRSIAELPLSNNMAANGVLGQLDFVTGTSGTSSGSLQAPSGVAIDPTTGKLFVVDRYNNRVLRWSAQRQDDERIQAEAVLGQPDFSSASSGLSSTKMNDPLRAYVDVAGRLWVSDYANNACCDIDNASSKATGCGSGWCAGQSNLTINSSGTTAEKMNGPVEFLLTKRVDCG